MMNYAEQFLILCITRGRECQVGDCKNCGWLRDEQKKILVDEEKKEGEEKWNQSKLK